jgi:hypothetical protein
MVWFDGLKFFPKEWSFEKIEVSHSIVVFSGFVTPTCDCELGCIGSIMCNCNYGCIWVWFSSALKIKMLN